MTAPFLEGNEQRQAFLSAFEEGSLPAEQWTHAAHIAMATAYLLRYREGVLAPTRAAIRNYLLARGKPLTNYHETLTIFWLALVDKVLRDSPESSEEEAVRRHHQLFGANSRLYREFYSFDVPASPEARLRWIEPDLHPLEVRFRIDPS